MSGGAEGPEDLAAGRNDNRNDNRNDGLDDGLVAALARQAVDQLDRTVDIDIQPDAGADPYRWRERRWTVWPLLDGHRSFGIHLDITMSPGAALYALLDALSEYSSESRRHWGRAFPRCLGHDHPARIALVDGPPEHVEFSCPVEVSVVATLEPVR